MSNEIIDVTPTNELAILEPPVRKTVMQKVCIT